MSTPSSLISWMRGRSTMSEGSSGRSEPERSMRCKVVTAAIDPDICVCERERMRVFVCVCVCVCVRE